MRAPGFWSLATPDWRARMLSPLGRLYAAATARRLAKGTRFAPGVPVICVGNINVGGTGKTPTVIALLERLRDLYRTPHVISRGYGGSLKGPVRVDPARHTADQVGDEPLLMANFADVWVADDRAEGARAAVAEGAQVLVLDDGFQDPALRHDLSLVVVDAATGFGNGLCLPAGPLREPAEVGLSRADMLMVVGDTPWSPPDTAPETVHATLQPLATGMPWNECRAFAFAGIGRPQKFFETLRDLGTDIVRSEALGDHAKLSSALLRRFEQDAMALGAQLVTTEKDAVRLPPSFRSKVITLPVRLQIDDDLPLKTRLKALTEPD